MASVFQVSPGCCDSRSHSFRVPPLRDEYFRMKLQWKSVSAEQERRNSLLHGYRSLIGGWGQEACSRSWGGGGKLQWGGQGREGCLGALSALTGRLGGFSSRSVPLFP